MAIVYHQIRIPNGFDFRLNLGNPLDSEDVDLGFDLSKFPDEDDPNWLKIEVGDLDHPDKRREDFGYK